jgi:hypothetical protein
MSSELKPLIADGLFLIGCRDQQLSLLVLEDYFFLDLGLLVGMYTASHSH